MVNLYKLQKYLFPNIGLGIFYLILILISGNVFGQYDPVVGDFKSKASGNWNDHTTWLIFNGDNFIDAVEGQIPSGTKSVFLEAGFTVTLTQDESIKDFHYNSEEDVLRFNTQEYTLDIWGKFRSYSGVAPGGLQNTANGTDPENNHILATGINGRIRFRGSETRIISSVTETSANLRMAGWNMDFALDDGAVGYFNNSMRVGSLTVTSGTMEIPHDGSHYLRVGTTSLNNQIDGKVIIKAGATLSPGAGISKTNTANNYFEELTVEEGGNLFFKQATGVGAASAILVKTINMNGTFGLIKGANQTFPSTTLNSTTTAAPLNTFNNLLLSESGSKTLNNNITIHGSLELKGQASINGPYNIAYGSEGTLKYSGSQQQTTSAKEYPNVDGPKNLIINNLFHVNLHEDKNIEGILTLTNGRLILGNYNLLFGENSGGVEGNLSADNLILLNGTGKVRKKISDPLAFSFPIGESTGEIEYSPVTITLNQGTLDASTYVELGVIGTRHPDDTSPNDYLSRYWTIHTNIPDIDYNAIFNYSDADVTGDEVSLNSYLYTESSKMPLNAIDHDLNQMEVTHLTSGGDFSGSNICGITNNLITAPVSVLFCSSGDPESIEGTIPSTGGSVEYSWEKSMDDGSWQTLINENSQNLNEGLISEYGRHVYRRLVYTDACVETFPHYSNSIVIIIEPSITDNTLTAPNLPEICESIPGFTIVGSEPTGGINEYTYSWERSIDGGLWEVIGGNTQNFTENDSNNNIGKYEYRRLVTSGSCEIASNIITIELYDALSLSAQTIPAFSSNNDGSIDLTISGGKPPYSIIWSNQSTSSLLEEVSHGVYTVTVMDSYGCQIEQEFNVPQVTGIETLQADEKHIVYPNPFINELNISFSKMKPSKVLMILMNSQGKAIFKKEMQNNIEDKIYLNLAALPFGFYYLNLISDGNSYVTKVQKGL